MDFHGKNILVVGFGVSGRAAARFLLSRGARVEVNDGGDRPKPDRIPRDLRSLRAIWGGHPKGIFRDRDLIVLSPGVPGNLPGLKEARLRGVPIVGEFGLAAGLLNVPMIAVTGTNGKSTTVTLIQAMLESAGKKTALAGNIGTPLTEILMGKKTRRALDWVVAEVSSYQLETVIEPFRPKISVLLNVTEDHLDRYASFRDYAAAKFRIFKDQGRKDILIYGDDDAVVRQGVRAMKGRKIFFSRREDFKSSPPYQVFRGMFRGNESLAYRRGRKVEHYPLEKAKLVGLHNQENMMAAIAAAREAGAPQKAVQKALESFEGLPHRTQFVREKNGVLYYDDSKGTNVDAAVKSLSGFPDKKVVLIAGGRDKGGSYRPLTRMAKRKVKLVLTIGEAGPSIARALDGAAEIAPSRTLEKAVRLAAKKSEPGDIVLLSPACSSFDQFRDYKERGDIFQKLVREL